MMEDMLRSYRGQTGNKTEDVIYRLVKRARLPRNRKVYVPDAIPIDFSKVPDWKGPIEGISFLDFALTVGEFPDAYIGRFLFNISFSYMRI